MTNSFPSETFSDAAREGLAFYDANLKSKLEPTQNGRAIALHIDTGEYVVADTLTEARTAMRQRYPNPNGRILSQIIGAVANDAVDRRVASTRKRCLLGDFIGIFHASLSI